MNQMGVLISKSPKVVFFFFHIEFYFSLFQVYMCMKFPPKNLNPDPYPSTL